MKLSVKTLTNVDGLNAFKYTENWTVHSDGATGENISLYFQIVDKDRENIRYIPSVSATMQVVFPALDDTKVISVAATFPFADDRSIMKVDLLSTQVPSSGAVRFVLTESSIVKSFRVDGAMSVEKLNSEIC